MLYYFIVRLCFSLHVFGTFAVLTLEVRSLMSSARRAEAQLC